MATEENTEDEYDEEMEGETDEVTARGSERVDVVLTESGEMIKCHQKQYAQHGITAAVNTPTTTVVDLDSGTEGTDLEVQLSEVSSGGDKKWQEIDKISLTEDNKDILKSNR